MSYETNKVINSLKETFPNMTWAEGRTIWSLLVNIEFTLPDGTPYAGTWRNIADIVAQAFPIETDYRDFYMASADNNALQEVISRLTEAGWKL